MTSIKIIIFIFLTFIGFTTCKDINTNSNNKSSIERSLEEKKVVSIMSKYKDGIQSLNTDSLLQLFSEESEVYESGSFEGTFNNYLTQHLAPELNYFNSFSFSDYFIKIKLDMPYAFVTESYIYSIEIKGNKEKKIEPRTISKKGITTSILKKVDRKWKIIKMHTSSRKNKKH